jgi:hypothetical protein
MPDAGYRTETRSALGGCPAETVEPCSAVPFLNTQTWSDMIKQLGEMASNNTLHRSSESLTSLKDLLRWAVATTGAERAYLAVGAAPGPGTDIVTMVTSSSDQPRPVSQTVIQEALTSRPSLVCLDTAADSILTDGPSVRQLALRSVVAAALPATCAVEGAVLLDSRLVAGAPEAFLRALVESLATLAGLLLCGAPPPSRKTRPACRTPPRQSSVAGGSRSRAEQAQWIRRVAAAQLPVLISGETGSGKERVATELHRCSPRHRSPFVAINCAAFTDSLLDAELFGAVRGSYTGADRDRQGVFERAHGGTLFLDEVGDMPQTMQAKLLRVLENGVVLPVGATRERIVDVRIVAATHRDLRKLVERDAFRQDLFHRLAVLEVRVPPLRDRIDELPGLVRALEPRLVTETGAQALLLADDAWDALAAHDWPGNVRELHSVLARALLAAGGEPLSSHHLNLEGPGEADSGTSLERSMIRRALSASPDNVTRAAQRIGWTRQKLYRRMQALGVTRLPRD